MITTVNEILELIAKHPAGYLVRVEHEMWGGGYDSTYPAKLSVEGQGWVISHTQGERGFGTTRNADEITLLLDQAQASSNATGWALKILKQNSFHVDEFISTDAADESRYLSAEKLFFRGLSTGEKSRVFILGDYQLSFKFAVTSFVCSIAVRGSFCPEAAGREPGPHQRSNEFLGIGSYTWGQNGSGFNAKYVEAIAFIKRFIAGQWEGLKPYMQDNRSASINARTGETNTRFWSAQLTFPDLAFQKSKKENKFPLFTSRLLFP